MAVIRFCFQCLSQESLCVCGKVDNFFKNNKHLLKNQAINKPKKKTNDQTHRK